LIICISTCHFFVFLFTTMSHPLFFFLLLPPPPISTLFPYTTLFRSLSYYHNVSQRPLFPDLPTRSYRPSKKSCYSHLPGYPESSDRKSTRLNSSHVSISYAVFCLKKKKIIIHP